MEIGRGHFQGSVEAHSHGTTPTIREVAHEGDAELSSTNAPEAGAHTEEGAPEGDPQEQSGVHSGSNFCPWSGSRFHSFVFVAGGFAEGQGHVCEARESTPGGRKKPPREGRGSESAEPIKVALEMARGQCRVLPVGERLDSCLKYVERAKGRVLKQQVQVQAAQELLAKFESQVAQGLADLERLRAEARVTPVATARPEEDVGNSIEELAALHREVDQLRRERDVWLGRTNPSQSMDTSTPGIIESRSSRMAALIDEADAKRRCVDVPSIIANCAL